ncbi:MAG: glycosyltransferase family 2 protein [Candidatus Symbiobacter sp.]|nr:glycosyltransferase family 2 protein [Candidatus Symbiobacter sp.]
MNPDLTLESHPIAVIIPCYRVESEIAQVLAAIPPWVSRIYCVDDQSPDDSVSVIRTAMMHDPRIRLIRHAINQGVGGAMVTGYRAALADDMTVMIKIDGDGQMSPDLIAPMIAPILNEKADYVKGNRFYAMDDLQSMPKIRLFGNIILSFMTKLSSGYYSIFDPTNGFTAIHRAILAELPLDKIAKRYFFESDMLFRLYVARAVVMDMPMKAKYGTESSSLRISRIFGSFLWGHARNAGKRILYSYFLRDFNEVSVGILLGLPLWVFGVGFGTYEFINAVSRKIEATAGTVMFGALPIILGTQFLLAAWQMDIANVPRVVRHKYLLGRDKHQHTTTPHHQAALVE